MSALDMKRETLHNHAMSKLFLQSCQWDLSLIKTVYCLMYLILCHVLVVDSERSTQSEAAVGWIAVHHVVEPKGSLC